MSIQGTKLLPFEEIIHYLFPKTQNTLGKTKSVANVDSSTFRMLGLQTLYLTAAFLEEKKKLFLLAKKAKNFEKN